MKFKQDFEEDWQLTLFCTFPLKKSGIRVRIKLTATTIPLAKTWLSFCRVRNDCHGFDIDILSNCYVTYIKSPLHCYIGLHTTVI